jgi:hypothetical protein
LDKSGNLTAQTIRSNSEAFTERECLRIRHPFATAQILTHP